MPDLSGKSIGRYQVVDRLGAGGMAVVYRGFDNRLECDIAIKFISMEKLSIEMVGKGLKRFEREAKSLAQLTHPNIVKVTDYGEYEGIPYLVMPYLSGGTLKTKMGQPILSNQAAHLLIQVARALEYAHNRGVIHRDVKPANILITESGEPMLSDFGVAKMLEIEAGTSLTGTGVGIGTPEYMAPEQVSSKNVDHRVDIYALGVVFYELITGQKPYTADTPLGVLLKHAADPLPNPRQIIPDLPKEVEHFIFKVMAKRPEDRYQNMGQVVQVLERIAGHKEINDKQNESNINASFLPTTGLVTGDETYDVLDNPDRAMKKSAWGKSLPRAWIWVGIGIAALVLLGVGALLGRSGAEQDVTLSFPSEEAILMENQPTMTETIKLVAPVVKNTIAPIGLSTAESLGSPISENAITQGTELPLDNNKGGCIKAGDMQISSQDNMELMCVPAGKFWMGAQDSDTHADKDEKPLHEINLNAFWIDKYEVTNKMYRDCVQDGICSPPNDFSSNKSSVYYSDSSFADFPVINVNWSQAQKYCQWAGRRLPTEAEWEKAARGDDRRLYPWGNNALTCSLANYGGVSGCVGDPRPVGFYQAGASPYGVMDMAGNVSEWVGDWYDKNYYSISTRENPTGPSSGLSYVAKGGSWYTYPSFLRVSNRISMEIDAYNNRFGFRCAVSN